MIMPQKLADPRARARPHFWPQRHERVEVRRCEHRRFDDVEPAVLRELPEIEHVIADGDTDARGETVLGGEHAVGEILDREMGIGRDVDKGAEFGIVGMGHGFPDVADIAEAVSFTLPWRAARMSVAKCETGWGDLSTRALLDVEIPSPHPATHSASLYA